MPFRKPNRKIVRRSFWGALGRLIGVMMGAGAGSLIVRTLGAGSALNLPIAVGLTVAGFLFIWFAEYEREIDE